MRIWPLALATGLLPAMGILLALTFSISEGWIAGCSPWLEGCTSVSRTGRHGSGFFVFKGMVLPAAGLLAMFWILAACWLRSCAPVRRRSVICLGLLGPASAVMLAWYASYLGSEGPNFALYRRIGASSFLAGNFFCQLIFASALDPAQQEPRQLIGLRVLRLLAGLQLMIGLASLPVTLWADPALKDVWENIFEWWFCSIQLAYFPVCAWLWRAQRLNFSPH